MSRLLTSIILLVASAGLFFGFIDPQYAIMKEKQSNLSKYTLALQKSDELRKIRDGLLNRLNGITQSNKDKLAKMLPDTVDNVRLVLDIDSIASSHGMNIKNIKVAEGDAGKNTLGPTNDGKPYGTISLNFGVTSSYDNFQNFISDLEKALRVVDVTSLSVRSNDKGLYDFDVNLKTYWLK